MHMVLKIRRAENSPEKTFGSICLLRFHKFFKATFTLSLLPSTHIWALHSNLSNCCQHKYHQSISRFFFKSNIWRDFAIWPNCNAGHIDPRRFCRHHEDNLLLTGVAFLNTCLPNRSGRLRLKSARQGKYIRERDTRSVEFVRTCLVSTLCRMLHSFFRQSHLRHRPTAWTVSDSSG